jgi:hypothetical protein
VNHFEFQNISTDQLILRIELVTVMTGVWECMLLEKSSGFAVISFGGPKVVVN